MYRLVKSLNNNVAYVVDEDNNSYIVTGGGISFKKKAGDKIQDNQIEKLYFANKRGADARIISLINSVEPDIFSVTDKIITFAEESIGKKMHDSLLFTLADHLNFSIERFNTGLEIRNPLYYEVKRLYPQEVKVGIASLNIVFEELSINLPKDEAIMIALHLVNSQSTFEMEDTIEMTQTIHILVKDIENELGKKLQKESSDYSRFIIHMRYFLAKNMFSYKNEKEDEENEMYLIAKEKYPTASIIVEIYCNYLLKEKKWKITQEEKLYLILHVQRLIKSLRSDKNES